MIKKVNVQISKDLSSHTRKLGMKRFFQSMGYERSGELPLIASKLKPLYENKIKLLDIGSGDSVFPTYILKKSKWDITCLDKFSWVQAQNKFASRIMEDENYKHRFHIIEKDFMKTDLPEDEYEIITNISVIEHFEGEGDIQAMKKSSKLLKKGGKYILTSLINEKNYQEFFIKNNVYGSEYSNEPVFFQRHYDVKSYEDRIVKSSGLHEIERIYIGEYNFQFFETFMNVPWPFKPVKLFYQWLTPVFARKYLTYRHYPVNRPQMKMYTSSCVFSIFEKD